MSFRGVKEELEDDMIWACMDLSSFPSCMDREAAHSTDLLYHT